MIKHPTCKEALKHKEEMIYVGSGFGYHLTHKRYRLCFIGTYSWNNFLWHCLEDNKGNIIKVLECFDIDC